MRNRWPLLLCLALFWVHRGGWWQGGVYYDEDVAAVFFTLKTRLYQLFHGQEAFSWWDPLTFLGWPRAAQIQAGWLSPLNLWFILVPPLWAWRLYPLLMDSLLLGASYWTIRQTNADRSTAGWASLAWVLAGTVLASSQQPCYKESVLSAILTMGCALRYWRFRQVRYLLALAGCGYLHLASGNPSALFFNHLSLVLLLPWLISHSRPPASVVVQALAAYLAGALLALPAWLPFLEYLGHCHRSGLPVAQTFRLTLGELLMRLASESHVGSPTPLQHAPGYSMRVDFSLALLLLALSGLAARSARLLLGLSLFTLLQTTGESGGLLWLLHKVFPETLQVRGPDRFFFLGGWALALAAALAWQHWRQQSRLSRWLSHGLATWALFFALLVQSWFSPTFYRPASFLEPPALPEPGPGRLAVLLRDNRPPPPLHWETSGVLQGRPTLIMPEVLLERGYLQGLALSQSAADQLDETIRKARSVPVHRPEAPLLLSWGLTWVLQGEGAELAWRRLQSDPPRHWFARPSKSSAAEFASRLEGDAFSTAQVENVADPTSEGWVEVENHTADYQELRVQGHGLLLSADQWDPGWTCLHDGQPVPVVRANLALKACWVKPGVKIVKWRYRPLWLQKAALWHLAGWVLLVGVAIVSRRRR